jgi:hypothetical protein
VAVATSLRGEILWDTSKPDGTPKKQLDVSRLAALGWRARIPLALNADRSLKNHSGWGCSTMRADGGKPVMELNIREMRASLAQLDALIAAEGELVIFLLG